MVDRQRWRLLQHSPRRIKLCRGQWGTAVGPIQACTAARTEEGMAVPMEVGMEVPTGRRMAQVCMAG